MSETAEGTGTEAVLESSKFSCMEANNKVINRLKRDHRKGVSF